MGLLSLTLCIQQDYILIKQLMNWTDAQSYCRIHHADLATVQSNENWMRLQEAADEKLFSGYAWIGLYEENLKSWRWSYNEESPVFKFWGPDQPDNYGSGEPCTAILSGAWYDVPCTGIYNFMCYDGSTNATQTMILSNTRKTCQEEQAGDPNAGEIRSECG